VSLPLFLLSTHGASKFKSASTESYIRPLSGTESSYLREI
jgi:hypothetical protein